MNKKISIFKATYGKLNEINRSQRSRDSSYNQAQSLYDNMGPDYADLDEESIYAKASELAAEQAESDASLEGFDNIDDYAMSPEHYNLKTIVGSDGRTYSPGEQLIYNLRQDFESMLRNGEL